MIYIKNLMGNEVKLFRVPRTKAKGQKLDEAARLVTTGLKTASTRVGIAGIAIAVTNVGAKFLNGETLTGRDYATLGVAALTGFAMATGVGTLTMGVVAIALDIYNIVSPEEK